MLFVMGLNLHWTYNELLDMPLPELERHAERLADHLKEVRKAARG